MTNQLQLQADVGMVGLAGLGAFTSLLSAMSTDNVSPMAMIQLENLGSLFFVNGPNASRVPEVLRRAISYPVGRLSLAVGWRRGDAISMLADSAGGQAISLLITSLMNIYTEDKCGLILSSLCSSLLPKSMPRSNPVQLADIAKLVVAKAGQLSFGNLLAQQTHRALSVYEQLGIKPPDQLLKIPAKESLVQLFESLSHLRMDDHLVRISGSIGLLYILSIVLFMFPYSTMVTIESMVIHDNEGRRIIIEVSTEEATMVQVETKLSPNHIKITNMIERDQFGYSTTSFLWDGWLAQSLFLIFARHGLALSGDFQEAFCHFMIQITPHVRLCDVGSHISTKKTFKELLGPNYQRRIAVTCQTICQYTPTSCSLNIFESLDRFSAVLGRELEPIKCICGECLDPIENWSGGDRACPRLGTSQRIGAALWYGIMCCLLEPQGSVVMNIYLFETYHAPPDGGERILRTLERLGCKDPVKTKRTGPLNDVPFHPFGTFLSLASQGRILSIHHIGLSYKGSSLYPAILENLEFEPNGMFHFAICEGIFVHDGVYYERLTANEVVSHRPGQERGTAVFQMSPIRPSMLRQRLTLTASLQVGFQELLLRFSVDSSGYHFGVAAYEPLRGAMEVQISRGCNDDIDAPLLLEYVPKITLMTVGVKHKYHTIDVYMTHGDRKAQFLACAVGFITRRQLFLKCCINCGVRQAMEEGYQTIIVP
ncbi:hypothetical protein F5Y16DRAFT_424381 [Xylariaceae sp. FL0255]|nr:hypothetical protein F5Y16DRAFT_424381 [Xylariaceae sp. FL0255]